MTVLTVDQVSGQRIAIRSSAVVMLQVFALTLMVFPSDFVIKAVGAGGYVAALVAYVMFLYYLAVTLFGLHNPLEYRYPVRFALCTLWLTSLASYALMDRTLLNSTQLSSADRWLIQLVGLSGVILVSAEFLHSLNDIHRVLRALVWGGAFCGIVAAMQYWLALNITPYLRILPGFSVNQAVGIIAIGNRSGLNRVVGTATDPIEFGVVAGMLLPLAVYLAMHDVRPSKMLRWIPVVFLGISVPISISRAAVLAAILSVGTLIIALPPARRLSAIAALPAAVALIFLTTHRLIGTIKSYFLAGTTDASIAHRVNNYPYVEHLVRQALLFGQGGGTYIPGNYANLGASHILDNQYLDTAIELGLLGLAALTFFLFWPFVAALAARKRSNDPRVRDLCAALAGSALAGLVCSATFDSLGFPMFANVEALVIGLIGAAWLLVNRENETLREAQYLSHHNGTVSRRLLVGSGDVGPSGGS